MPLKRGAQGFAGIPDFTAASGEEERTLKEVRTLCTKVREREEKEPGSTYRLAVIIAPIALQSQPTRHPVVEDLTQQISLLDATVILSNPNTHELDFHTGHFKGTFIADNPCYHRPPALQVPQPSLPRYRNEFLSSLCNVNLSHETPSKLNVPSSLNKPSPSNETSLNNLNSTLPSSSSSSFEPLPMSGLRETVRAWQAREVEDKGKNMEVVRERNAISTDSIKGIPALCTCEVSQGKIPQLLSPSTTVPGCSCGQQHLAAPPTQVRTEEEEAQLCVNILLRLPNAERVHELATMDEKNSAGDGEEKEGRNEQLELSPMDIDSTDNDYDLLVTDKDNAFTDRKDSIRLEITPPSLDNDSERDQLFLVTSDNESVIWDTANGTKSSSDLKYTSFIVLAGKDIDERAEGTCRPPRLESRSPTPLSLPSLHSVSSSSSYTTSATESSSMGTSSVDSNAQLDYPVDVELGEKRTLNTPMPERPKKRRRSEVNSTKAQPSTPQVLFCANTTPAPTIDPRLMLLRRSPKVPNVKLPLLREMTNTCLDNIFSEWHMTPTSNMLSTLSPTTATSSSVSSF
ncbi:hypothetical protein GYMLUDRAFT_251499, partial [Collybiopsis luxurians FD-317 M1]